MVVQPAPQMALPRSLPLVGRKAELERLYRLFGHESRSEPAMLLSGDPGIGKSRIVHEVATEARRRGWRVAAGRAYPVETGIPYNLIADAFLPLLRSFDEPALTVLTRGTSGDLRQLFPALGTPEAGRGEGWDQEDARTRLFWTFTEFLKQVAEREPLLIVAEDLHWADASSLSLLHFLARQLQGEPIRVLGTASNGYGGEMEGLGRIERSLASLNVLERHELSPLTLEATEELLQVLFQVRGSPLREFSAHLYEWTHGNPYFLEETLRALVRTGRLYRRDGTWLGWEGRNLDLPPSVRDAVLLRLRSLSEDARSVAELVSVGGGRLSIRLLGVVSGLETSRLMDAVEELAAMAVADELEEADDVALQLRHPMLRESLYRSLGPSRRRLLHRQLAEALEELHRGGTPPVDQLAYHFTRGGPGGLDARATRYLAEAGFAASGRHADQEAADYLQAALERYPDRGADGRAGLPARSELEVGRARVLSRLGCYGDASVLWASLLERARERDDPRECAEALRHLGLLAFWSGRPREALRRYDEALDALRDLGHLALEVRIGLAAGVALQELGRAEDARLRIESCLELARGLEDPTILGRVHRALALLFTWVGRAEDARRHGRQAVELADREGDPYLRFWGLWALASLEGLSGKTEEMSRLIAQAGQVAEEIRSPVLSLWTSELEVEYAYAVGDWDTALAQGERAIHRADNLGQTTLLPRLLVWTANVYIGRGDLERARELVDRAWSLAGLDEGGEALGDVHVVVPAHIGTVALHLAEERYDDAVAVGEAGTALADGAGYVFWSLHGLLPMVAEAHIRRRDLDSARAVGRRLRDEGHRIGHPLALAWADTCDALILWISGDLEGGLGFLQSAAQALEAIPMSYEAARIRRQVAGRLAEMGRREEALAELRSVHEVFGRLGAQPELDRCRDMFRQLDARPPSRNEAEGTAGLTSREWAIAQRVSLRLSNKAVARELGISHRTVTTHMSNIYRKLAIGSREELVDMVREGRLPVSTQEG